MNLKNIYPLFLSIIIGTIFGMLLFNDVKEEVVSVFGHSDYLSFFQVGVFLKEENAVNFKEKYEGSIIINDEKTYRVYVAILKNEENITYMKKYFDDLKINYYIKNILVNNEKFLKELSVYEDAMIEAKDKKEINDKILELYLEILNDTKRTT